MRLTLNAFGDEIATLDADPAWQLQDVLMTLSNHAFKDFFFETKKTPNIKNSKSHRYKMFSGVSQPK